MKKFLSGYGLYWIMAIYITILSFQAMPYAIAPIFVMTSPRLRNPVMGVVARIWMFLLVISITVIRINQLISSF